jgi:hypothetical protein
MIGFVYGAENRVTLSAKDQPLGEVLQNIQKASGVDVVLTDKKWINDPVTCSVKNLELEKALGVVFGGYNYVLAFEANKGSVSKVLVTVYEKRDEGATQISVPVIVAKADCDKVPMADVDLDALSKKYYAEKIACIPSPQRPEGLSEKDVAKAHKDLRSVVK